MSLISLSEVRRRGLPSARSLATRKALIIVENLPVPFDRRVWQEARALRDAGAEVSIICPIGKGSEELEETLEGIHIYRHRLPLEAHRPLEFLLEYGAALFHETRLAWKVLFRHGFDTIHACNPPDLIFLVALPFKLMGKRFIFDHHDINPELFEAKFGKRQTLETLVPVRMVDVQMRGRRHLHERKLSPDRVVSRQEAGAGCLRRAIRTDLTRINVHQPDASLKKGRNFLVGYVGVMGEQEGIDLLLQSVRQLVQERGRQDVQFVLVGGGPQLEQLKASCTEMGLSEYVTFLGRVPDDLLFTVLSTADVCVNPDRVNPMNDKSTMNKILEYMAFGKPIVQFDVTEGRFSAGAASLYSRPNDPVDFSEKIESLLDDAAARAAMGEVGRSRLQRELAWSYQVPALIAAYRRAAHRSQATG